MATAELVKADPIIEAVAKRGFNEVQWRTLCNSLYPGAKPQSVLMVLDYCVSRKLDPMKKPCHIVPMKVKDPQSGNYEWRDVVMPGIYEYRTTAMRTGLYLGHSKPEYGPVVDHFPKFEAPDWCEMTIYRRASNGDRIEFPVRVYFREAVKLKDGRPNDRWSTAPIQMLTKCTEAAGLREAFPDEFGGEQTAEEMDGQIIEVETVKPPQPALRLSQPSTPAVATPSIETPAKKNTPATATDAPKNIGVITDVKEMQGGAMVMLDTGFKCSTKDGDTMKAAASLRDSKRRVELVTTPSSEPTKYVPRLSEIQPLPEQGQ